MRRLDGEGARILSLVGAEQERRLAFRDPAGAADHRHGNGLDKAVLNNLDLRRILLDRDLVQSAGTLDHQEAVSERPHSVRVVERAGSLQRGDARCLTVRHGYLEQAGRDECRDVEIAVRTKRDAVKADAILGRREKRIRRPDVERGAFRVEAVHVGRERVGCVGGAISAAGDVVAHRLRTAECKTAFRCAGVEIEGFQKGTLDVGGPRTPIPVISLGRHTGCCSSRRRARRAPSDWRRRPAR